jgi:hypothetical protein
MQGAGQNIFHPGFFATIIAGQKMIEETMVRQGWFTWIATG